MKVTISGSLLSFNKAFLMKALIVLILLCTFSFTVLQASPKQTRPNAGQIVLNHADQVVYNQFKHGDMQIFLGNVSFFHNGMTLYCDSANYFQTSNSFEAFGHVRMVQGDTLSLVSKFLYYDGNSQIAQARQEVVLKHNKTTLYTDSLNYDKVYNEGYFFEGGKLVDGENVLISDWGQYETDTRQALFNYNVKLTSKDYIILSDTLYYNTITKLAHITGPSNVTSQDTRIYTENADFNTDTNHAVMLDRSVLVNKNQQMIGDSVVYDKKTGVSQAFRDVIINDKQNKCILTGDYCYYNDSTGYSIAYGKAQMKSYSDPDTLFLHADTFKIHTYNIRTDSVYREIHGFYHSRSYRQDMQSVADSLVYNSTLRTLFLYGNPIVWNDSRQVLGEEIRAYMNDSTMDSVRVINQALMVERLDSIYYNQVSGTEMQVFFDGKNIRECRVISNVRSIYFPYDSDSLLTGMNYSETSLLRMFMADKKLQKIWTKEIEGTFYPLALVEKSLLYLSNFAWFDYMRPKNKYDIFEWKEKTKGTELKKTVRRIVPFQQLEKMR